MLEVLLNLYSVESFLTMVFTFIILRIMIILVGLNNPFEVCITINTTLTFPICNYFLLIFWILFCSFFFLCPNISVLHVPFLHFLMLVHPFGCILHNYIFHIILHTPTALYTYSFMMRSYLSSFFHNIYLYTMMKVFMTWTHFLFEFFYRRYLLFTQIYTYRCDLLFSTIFITT